MKHWDLAIVGAGVMGLAHAVYASRAGLSVVVFERSPKALGASVQNFGMLAIIAQASGRQLADARRALADWQEIADQAGIEMEPSGCLFLAREPEEMSVLEEFCHAASMSDHSANLVKQDDLCRYAAGLRSKNLLGGLWSRNGKDRRLAAKSLQCIRSFLCGGSSCRFTLRRYVDRHL